MPGGGSMQPWLDYCMPRYALLVSYDGTGFCGWQKQEPVLRAEVSEDSTAVAAYGEQTPLIESDRPGRVALRTVQGVLERAVREVVRQPIELFGASRTDSGVHARGQVAAFSCAPLELPDGSLETGENLKGFGWPPERGVDRLISAINSRLPSDVVVRGASLVRPQFDPVGDATRKAYSYTFCVSHERPIAGRECMMHVGRRSSLDVLAMDRAAKRLIGEFDFAAFAASGHGRKTTVRRVDHAAVFVMEEAGGLPAWGTRTCGPRVISDEQAALQRGPRFESTAPRQIVRLEIAGNGFLWNMVRIIAGTLLQVGIGAMDEACITRGIESLDRRTLGPTAPPEGLCLEWIEYGRGEAMGTGD